MNKILFRVHALQRIFERKILAKRVVETARNGEIIEDYSAAMPEPGRLILGFQGNHPFHVVTSENSEAEEIIIITVYIPDLNRWNKDFRSRRA